MKASYRWLVELLPGLEASPEEVARLLTSLGLEVEGVSTFGGGVEKVIVAEVVAVEPHPSKDGLRLVTVSRGDGTQKVVCGAPNVPPPGGKVALAPLGTHLPAKKLTIEPRAIGGVVSEGMLCSESELGLGDDADGIWVLDTARPAGTSLHAAYPSALDTIYEIGVTPNRPDALGHVGIARDLATKLALPFTLPHRAAPPGEGPVGVDVTIEDAERCASYGAGRVRGVRIAPSPLDVRHRLTSLGIRPVSNVVDVTNLVLLEHGHPMHAFDVGCVAAGKVIVRRAKEGEALVTLDGTKHALVADDLVIADPEKALALAGVMGGKDSEIREDTTDVLLECAYFDPRGVRRSSRRHGLHTESSHRFERGVDPNGVEQVLARATELLVALAGGTPAREAHVARARTIDRRSIPLRSARLDALLGEAVPWDEATAILGRLGCEVAGTAERATVLAPTHRPDLAREADLVEEVARVRGMDRIQPTLPRTSAKEEETFDARAASRDAALSLGLSEAVTYAFVAPASLAALSAKPAAVLLENPLTEERSVLRTSILPGLLEAASRAARRGQPTSRLFTTGRIFLAPDAGSTLPREERRLGVVLVGPRPSWLQKPEPHDALDAKSVALEIVARATGHEATVTQRFGADVPPHHHPRASAVLSVGETTLGTFGLLHPDAADAFGLSAPAIVELDLDAIEALGKRTPRAKAIPEVPAVLRDLALVVHEDRTVGAVMAVVRDVAGKLCEDVELFDVFRGGSVPEDHRSLAFHLVYRDPSRTLTDKEVDELHAAVVAGVKGVLGAELRA